MINLADVPKNVDNSKAVLDGERKTLLAFTEKYLKQIEQAEQKIDNKTPSFQVKKINEQREFIDALINFLQSTDNTMNMLSHYISDMLEFYEAEISSGGKVCHDVQFWQNQTIRKDASKRRIIKAFSRVLTPEQNLELHKLLIE